MTSVAYAAGAAPAGGPPAIFAQFVPIILIFVVFYFLLIRPQQKKAKEHQNFLNNLKKGDVVISRGGIQGVITGLTDTMVTLEIADKVRIKVVRGYLQGTASDLAQNKEETSVKAGK